EDWEVSDDQLTWTFTLRDDVTWHDGEPFTADDVVHSLNRIKEEGQNAWRLSAVEQITAADDHTVEIQVAQPTPNLLANLGAFKGMAIVPEHVDPAELAQEPVGTGPFSFGSSQSGSSITLEANPDYWGEGPNVEAVEFRFIPEGSTAMANLRAGDVHWTDNIPPQDVARVLEGDDIQAEAVPSNDYWYVAFNQNREPFGDVNVRRALAMAIDREAVTQAAKFDAATVNQTAIPQDSFWHYDYAPFERDVEEARRLLQEAGAEGLTIDLMVTSEYEETIQAAQVLEANWREIGVDTNIRTLDFSAWLAEQGEGNFDAFMLGWLGNIDPDDFYYAQHHTGANFNFHGYSNAEVDRLLDEARTETDQDARKELYDQAVKLIVDEVSYAYLYNPDVVHAWTPQVSGYTVRPDRAIRFKDVALES
ncbi:MAG TPA: ABC transporter substrate-binding protein, partial [Egibacteraceae bacterium]|nr:ABC transporter substrate-binding protein [Egibacteraceae bacterium]